MLACEAGYYCTRSDPVGSPCPAGRFADGVLSRNSNCSGPCAAGFVCPPRSTSSKATKCPAGQLCPQGAAAPQPCPAGFYCPEGSGDVPLLDPVTKLELAIGPTGLCAAGYFCPPNSTTSGGVVAESFSVDARGAISVRSFSAINFCPPGTTNAFLGASSVAACLPCPRGTYSPGQGSNLPVCPGQCPAGKYGIIEGQSTELRACRDCLAGRYSAAAGSQVCLPCQIGSYAPAAGES